MAWKRKIKRKFPKRNFTKIKNYSISRVLRKQNKINTEFEVMLSSLSLEDIIALKLELAVKSAGGYLYGIPIWKTAPPLIKEAILKFAYSACYSKGDISKFLGLRRKELLEYTKTYKIEEYFSEKEEIS
tara:strand:+ start:368 stop:754 length:387 start_codon:yes stop_codon:yes gene_type:complete